MPARALWTGVFLILISIFAIMIPKPSPSAVIPGALGSLIALLGIVANANQKARRHAIHAALVLAVIGMLGALPAVPDFIALLRGAQVERPVEVMAQFATVFICLAFVVRGVQSFIEARRKGT